MSLASRSLLDRGLGLARPHMVREGGLWTCRMAFGPVGYGFEARESYDEWEDETIKRAKMARTGPLGRLYAHVGEFILE